MTVTSFVDTNVLVYAEAIDHPAKQRRAQAVIDELLPAGNGWVSIQVLQEYYSVATRKLRVDPATARSKVELYSHFGIVKIDAGDVLAAIDLHRRHGFSIWDALIIRAALLAGCRRLYSEDLQHGFKVEGLEVINPF